MADCTVGAEEVAGDRDNAFASLLDAEEGLVKALKEGIEATILEVEGAVSDEASKPEADKGNEAEGSVKDDVLEGEKGLFKLDEGDLEAVALVASLNGLVPRGDIELPMG